MKPNLKGGNHQISEYLKAYPRLHPVMRLWLVMQHCRWPVGHTIDGKQVVASLQALWMWFGNILHMTRRSARGRACVRR
eukprot:4901946-Alexandrium_andersonii.AAC.1